MILIGDTHGKIEKLVRIVDKLPLGKRVVQLGDMGLGFAGVHLPHLRNNFQFIRGNHDSPSLCQNHANYLGEYGYLSDEKTFYIGGAFSIDRAHRVEGISWWCDEELSTTELNKAVEFYTASKPRIVISHECPSKAGVAMLRALSGPYFAAKQDCCNSRTSQALQAMFDVHQPEQWVFGHYHVDADFDIGGKTKFHCCAELSTYEVETC